MRYPGFKHSIETKGKMRVAHAGGKNHFYGKQHTEESLQKMRESHSGCVAWNKGKKLTEEHINNLKGKRPNATKEGNHNWIKDRTKLAKRQERNDSAYKEWRKSVRDRDGWVCKMSNGDCLGKVVAHHILPWSKFPELRYNINNGITLCRFHHPRKREDEMKLSPYFQSLVISNSN